MTTRRWSILVVEDDALFRESLVMLLEEEGFDVVAAGSATEALEAAAEHHFHLIVTDVRMPGMDGIAMLDRVRQESPGARAIVITGYTEFQVPVDSVRVQVDDLIPKPFDRQAFLASVRRSLEWLEREAWWDGLLRFTLDEAHATLAWVLPRLRSADAPTLARSRRLAQLVGSAARDLALPADVVRSLEWASGLLATGDPTLPEALCLDLEPPRGSAPAAGPLEHPASLRHILAAAATLARQVRAREAGPTPSAIPAGSTPVALLAAAHSLDAWMEEASSEPAEAIARLREAPRPPRAIVDALEKALAGPASAPEARRESPSRSLAALGVGYLKAGRADMARDALAQALETGAARPSSTVLTSLALAHGCCGDAPRALEAAEQALAMADTALEETEALATRGAVRMLGPSRGGDDDLAEALSRCALHGSRKGEIRVRLLHAWAASHGSPRHRPAFEGALRGLLDEVEGSRLDWALQRDRWLAVEVLRQGRARGVDAERCARWLSRLDADRGDADREGVRPDPRTLRIEALGRLRIRIGDREIREEDWKTTKSKWLFLVLLLHGGREVADDRLVDLFWESQDADRARQNLYSTLTYVRRALSAGEPLAEDPVIHRRGQCRFNLAVPHRVDFLEFDERLRKGLARWDAGAHAEAVPLLSAALDLYQGDLLESHDEPWVLPHRRTLRDRAVLALEHVLAHQQRLGDATGASATAERLRFVEPCHQGAYQCLMRIAAESGQPERVARLYRACVRALRDELGISPSPRTTALYHGVVDAGEAERAGAS